MSDRRHDPYAPQGQHCHGSSQSQMTFTDGQSPASSTYHGYNTYAPPSRQTSPSAPRLTQYTVPAGFTTSTIHQTKADSSKAHRYYKVPRGWTSQRSEREQITENSASAYGYNHSHNHEYDRYAPQTYPEQMPSSRGRSRQLTTQNLEGYNRQTLQSSNVARCAQQSQQEEPWNGIGFVRKRSEYDPYNTKL